MGHSNLKCGKMQRTGLVVVLCTLAAVAVVVAVDPPTWVPFSADFNGTTKIVFTEHTTGTYWWSPECSVTYRANGKGDRYCGSEKPLENTPCTQIATGGERYLYCPEKSDCCSCCTFESGCSPVSADWLTNATFDGEANVGGSECYEWNKMGLQKNLYYGLKSRPQVPVLINMEPNDEIQYSPASYNASVDPSSFCNLPSVCKGAGQCISVVCHLAEHNLL